MKYILTTLCIGILYIAARSQNTEANTPNKGEAPCARPQIVTNPFIPKNTEWYSMRNRFNWMDYVTWHNRDKFAIPYYDKQNLYGNEINSTRTFTNPFLDNNQSYLRHINLKDNTTNLYTPITPTS